MLVCDHFALLNNYFQKKRFCLTGLENISIQIYPFIKKNDDDDILESKTRTETVSAVNKHYVPSF